MALESALLYEIWTDYTDMTGIFSMEEIIAMEQRGQIRYKAQFSAALSGSHTDTENTQANATVTNLSLSGLQLECDHEVMSNLIPRVSQQDAGNPICIQVHFQVPTSQQSRADIDLECLIVYTRRVAQNRYLIGAQFKKFEHHCDADLEDYLRHFGERVDAPY
ncbi:MAG: hypothetical protein CL693_15495 [Cellvibrionaceae bacterium]|nr:hypothetical protein [Cellvibrionaceae bacterium]|tara:strand:- start:4316 stop:4804 length:489 start_codon:yes stop_codon:yes gene_type:complete